MEYTNENRTGVKCSAEKRALNVRKFNSSLMTTQSHRRVACVCGLNNFRALPLLMLYESCYREHI